MDVSKLGPDRWSRRLFSGGWAEPEGGTIAVVEPATGLTQPEDCNPPQARRLLPLLDIDSVHRTGVPETYPRVRQNC